MNRNSAIGAPRYKNWLANFATYRVPITQPLIDLWLEQFEDKDRDLAARVLDSVLFLGGQHIGAQFKQLIQGQDGWAGAAARRKGRWFFVPFSGSAGESGDSMVHVFRIAMAMTSRMFHYLFINRSELVGKKLTPEDTVVLVDDFSGSGDQACEWWKKFSELLAGGPRVVLLLAAATSRAVKRIADETEMEPICGTTLLEADNFFSSACTYYSADEKEALLEYCKKADKDTAKGRNDCGLLVVLGHRCPNNSLPILHVSKTRWQGLFPR